MIRKEKGFHRRVARWRGGVIRGLVLMVMDYRNKSGNDEEGWVDGGFFSGWSVFGWLTN